MSDAKSSSGVCQTQKTVPKAYHFTEHRALIPNPWSPGTGPWSPITNYYVRWGWTALQKPPQVSNRQRKLKFLYMSSRA